MMDADQAKAFAEYLLKQMADGLLGRDRPLFDFDRCGDRLVPRQRRFKLPVIDPVLDSEIVLEDILDAEVIGESSYRTSEGFEGPWPDTVTYRMTHQMVPLCLGCSTKLIGENRGVFLHGGFYCSECVRLLERDMEADGDQP